MPRTIAVIGLGKLGLPIAASLAAKGHRVLGVDVDEARVAALSAGETPSVEPGLTEMLAQADDRFTASTDVASAVRDADVVMTFVPTPSTEDGSFALDLLLVACADIGAAMREDDRYRVVVVNSTVSPGSTTSEVLAALESASGRACGDGFGLCYSPEFVALGNVVANFLRPDMVLIGQSDDRAGDVLEEVYLASCDNEPPVMRMHIVNAEIAKLAVNTYVTTKIDFANMLAELCSRVRGGDIDAVTTALGMDARIGSRYLKGGLGYGGPCFPRDNRALSRFAESIGVEAPIPRATHAANLGHTQDTVAAVRAMVGGPSTVAVVGLAYRPSTDVIEESASIALAEALAADGHTVLAYDPFAMDTASQRLGDSVRMMQSLEDCVAATGTIIVAMPWPGAVDEIEKLLGSRSDPIVLIDCWRELDPARLPASARYMALGVASG